MCDFLQSNGLVVSDFAPLLIHAVITKQCNELTYHTMQCNAMECNAMQRNEVPCNFLPTLRLPVLQAVEECECGCEYGCERQCQ